MNLPSFLYALRWLMWDTVRLAMASGLFWVMIAVTTICTLFCFSLGVQGDVPLKRSKEPAYFLPDPTRQQYGQIAAMVGAQDPLMHATMAAYMYRLDPNFVAERYDVDMVRGKVTLAFGAIEIPLTRDRTTTTEYVQLVMAGWVADAAGILLALVWTAGFLPSFLEPSAAAVLIAKPMPRWGLLLGKYLGVLAFVLFQATLFVGLTWLALALKLGVWDVRYLACIPLLLLHFAIFFSFSIFVAVCTRSTVACVIGSILFWLLCWAMNFGRHAFLLTPELQQNGSAMLGFFVDAGYWIMPKPADMGLVLFDVMAAEDYFGRVLDVKKLESMGGFMPELSIVSSLAFTVVILAISAHQFKNTDY